MNTFWTHVTQNPAIHFPMVDFISTRIWPEGKKLQADTIMGVADGETVVAGVGFHNYDSEAGVVEISAASDDKRWLTRPVLREMFGYAFDQLGCQSVVARIDAKNVRLARIFKAYGFREYVIPRLRGRNDAERIMVLYDDAWQKNGFHKDMSNG